MINLRHAAAVMSSIHPWHKTNEVIVLIIEFLLIRFNTGVVLSQICCILNRHDQTRSGDLRTAQPDSVRLAYKSLDVNEWFRKVLQTDSLKRSDLYERVVYELNNHE